MADKPEPGELPGAVNGAQPAKSAGGAAKPVVIRSARMPGVPR